MVTGAGGSHCGGGINRMLKGSKFIPMKTEWGLHPPLPVEAE